MPANPLSSRQETNLLANDERWLSIQRVVESAYFKKSPRLCGLLLYLAEHSLAGRRDLLTEYHIATRVFERPADFNPDVDTIVRSHMVRLRQKLEQYGEENTTRQPVRVTVPKGEYRVRFETAAAQPAGRPVATLQSSATLPGAPLPGKQRIPLLIWACGLLCVVVLLLFALLMAVLERSRDRAGVRPVAAHPLWSQMFQPRQTTTLVAADSGLVLLHKMTGKTTTLQEYLTRDFSQEMRGLSPGRMDEVLNIGERRYTSFVDLNIYRRLQQLAAAIPGRLEVRYARDMQMNEMKQGNVILSGSLGANPWLALYEPTMNFVGVDERVHHGYRFINRHPQAGEAEAYTASEGDPAQRVLGVLAYLPNVEGGGNTLIVEGNSMAGTEAISDFLFDDGALLPFLAKLKRPDSTLCHFEVLIEANSVNGSAGPFHILAYRVHP